MIRANSKRNIFLFLSILLLCTNIQAGAADYLIGAEDVLSLSVWETPDLNLEVSVRPDGKISFPLVGDLQASGLTPLQLKESLTKKLLHFIKEPIVTVIVADIRSPKVYIQGEITNPGTYILKKKTTILELLTDAGGVTEKADLQRAYLLRNNQKVELDFYKLLKKADTSHNIFLLPGDYISLPDNFAKRITVLGEVTTPQVLPFKEGLTVLDAIITAEWLTEHADLDNTTVIRKDGTKTKEIEVDMEAVIEDRQLKQNILLMPGDTVIVGESWL